MNKKEINIDYIGVVKENNGSYTVEQIEIQQSVELLGKLKAMFRNPNRTVFDMQECLEMHFKNSRKRIFCICPPYYYSSTNTDDVCYMLYSLANINDTQYPTMMEFEKYNTDKLLLIDKVKARCNERRYSAGVTSVEDEIEQELKKYEIELKRKFLNSAARYIYAVDFEAALTRLKNIKEVKMYSHAIKGWKTVEYKISSDLIITVKTNFDYGSVSHFCVNVQYKGIDLLPYSQLVQYYYANMAEVIRHTRSYNPERRNWQIALDFVARIGNKVQQGDISFVRSWLKYEIDEMISGLLLIQESPKEVLNEMKKQAIYPEGLQTIRVMNSEEAESYEIYPEEMSIAFKAEKITSALSFIDKLQMSGDIYQPALAAIDAIKDLNTTIAPEIEEYIGTIHCKIEELNMQLERLYKDLAPCEEALHVHEDALNHLYEQNKTIPRGNVKDAYCNEHPDYATLCETRKELQSRIDSLKRDLNHRNRFLCKLQECYARIADAGILAA